MANLHRARVVLLAGGKGERFWPRSTPELPKQFLRISGDRSLLRATYERATGLVPPDSIYVVTGARYADLTRAELPELPEDNLIFEPEGRDTAASLGLAALWLEQTDPEAVMIVLPADHHIVEEEKFCATVEAAVAAAVADRLVTLGVNPTRPETGYGYIQVGDVVGHHGGLPVHHALRFVEKPELATAATYLTSGDYLWNSGMFVWSVAVLRSEIQRYLPRLHSVLEELTAEGGLQSIREHLPRVFGQAPQISIDFGVMEKSDRVTVVPAYFGWDDVGTWAAIERMRPRDGQGNCLQGDVVVHDAHGLIVEGGRRRVAAVGVSDLIVVDTDDALLVCSKSRAQDVKKVATAAPLTHLSEAVPNIPQPTGQVVDKPWGREIWWAVTEQYVGKVLDIRAGHSVNLRDQEQAVETLYFQSGRGRLRVGAEWLEVAPGKVTTIAPGTVRQVVAVTDLSVIEVSAPQLDTFFKR